METLHYWHASDGSQVFGLKCTSFDDGEDSLPFWKWRREIPGSVERITVITKDNSSEKLLENVDTAI
jgi:hypothetical protein